MTKTELENLIIGLKASLFSLYGDRIAFNSFEVDEEGVGLLIQPLEITPYKCLKDELVQFQIIDTKEKSSSLEMQEYLDFTKEKIIGNLKSFNGFETIIIKDTGTSKLLKNNKERYVYTFRLNFIY